MKKESLGISGQSKQMKKIPISRQSVIPESST